MTIKTIPAAPDIDSCTKEKSEVSPKALDRWNHAIRAADEDENTISIYDRIGFDWWTGEGVTAKRISAALRSIGNQDVVVNINSPGGDVFEGLAIYNLLREHKAKVTVRILGLAASAASFIAMAGDEIQIGRAAFLMIHNSWTLVAGDRNDLVSVADSLEQIDQAMADIYALRSGNDIADLREMMDTETWISGSKAVDQGFADDFLPSDITKEDPKALSRQQQAARKLDAILAEHNIPRSERRALIQELRSSKPGAAGQGTPGAAEQAKLAESLADLQRAVARFSAAAKN